MPGSTIQYPARNSGIYRLREAKQQGRIRKRIKISRDEMTADDITKIESFQRLKQLMAECYYEPQLEVELEGQRRRTDQRRVGFVTETEAG